MSSLESGRKTMPARQIWRPALVFFLTLSPSTVHAQAGPSIPMPDCECGIVTSREYTTALRPSALTLLAGVEAAFGKTVCIEEAGHYAPNEHGKSCITKDGTPVIKLNPRSDDTERTIVHELFHLKFRAAGFADVDYYFPDLTINKDVLLSIDNTFLQTVEHWMFLPAIRKMGIDPTAHHKAALRAGEYRTVDRTDLRTLAYRYYDTKLLVDDANLVSELSAWYKANGLTDAIAKGEELVGLVTDSNPGTPTDEISTYLKILNAVPGISTRFELDSWKEGLLGSFRWHVAVIRIRAAR